MNSDYKTRGLKNGNTSTVHTLPMTDVHNGQLLAMALLFGYWPTGDKESPVIYIMQSPIGNLGYHMLNTYYRKRLTIWN
jgi:hypothetical protein